MKYTWSVGKVVNIAEQGTSMPFQLQYLRMPRSPSFKALMLTVSKHGSFARQRVVKAALKAAVKSTVFMISLVTLISASIFKNVASFSAGSIRTSKPVINCKEKIISTFKLQKDG